MKDQNSSNLQENDQILEIANSQIRKLQHLDYWLNRTAELKQTGVTVHIVRTLGIPRKANLHALCDQKTTRMIGAPHFELHVSF